MKIKYILCITGLLSILIIASILILNGKDRPVSNSGNGQVTSVAYHKDGIEGEYPRLISGGNSDELKIWNQLIRSDFDKILKIYSFNPLPEPAPEPGTSVPTILTLTYNMKLNNERYTSILYLAAFRSPYAAHPTDLVYTTNIDKEKGERIRLKDMVTLNQDFVGNFRTWELVTEEDGNPEIIKGIKDYLAGLSDKDILMGMQAADIIGSGNLYDTFSYLTPDRLGISIGVPNYLGDHAQFEQNYTKLNKLIKKDLKVQ